MSTIAKSQDDINMLLLMAKINQTRLETYRQSLCSGASLASDSVILLELDPLAVKALKDGQNLTIRGKVDDKAVCCSYDKTFEIKETETSNSLLLFANDLCTIKTPAEHEMIPANRKVECIKRSYYELKPGRPRTKWLREKLELSKYCGNLNGNSELYTFEDLLEVTGSSEKELIGILKRHEACLIEGYWRLIDFLYLSNLVVGLVMDIKDAGIPYEKIPHDFLKSVFSDDIHRDLIDHIINLFTEPMGPDHRCLNEGRVCRLFAERLLQTGRQVPLNIFLETWQKSVPDGFTTDLDQLKNMTIVQLDPEPSLIRYFPVHQLPDDINERFEALFKAKDKWTLEEIAPFLEDICSDLQGLTRLLMKYSRMSTLNDVRVFSTRKS